MIPALLLAANLALTDVAACNRLRELALLETTILATEVVAGTFTPPVTAMTPTPRSLAVPAACRVVGRIQPAVNFEVWLPLADWNGKFQGVGNGGGAGVVNYAAVARALTRGYATASTDTGHATPGGSWALAHPELVTDFAYRAIHEMTVKAKAIVAAFYGTPPRKSYFVGCSAGGRQGLMEAQRFPADYDGIVAGAPAHDWTQMMAGWLWVASATLKDAAARLPAPALAALNAAALAACDSHDGVTDGLIGDPTACRFDPGTLTCPAGPTDACLTASQVNAARKIYSPAVNLRTGAEIYPGLPPGSERSWTELAGGPEPHSGAVDFYKYFVRADPAWDWKTMDFDTDVAAADEMYATVMNATNPDLTAFKARGGKLILYHGGSDQLVPPPASIRYYDRVVKAMGARETDDFARLFMAPGMLHCIGGVGPNTFDTVGALEQWVEQGTKPASLLASGATDARTRTRPLCPYPQVATYTGSGSVDDAANFVCR